MISHSGFFAGGLSWLCLLLSMVPFSRAFDSMSFQFVPSPPLSYRCISSIQNMATFSSTVNGNPVNTLFDCQSLISTISPSFSRQIVLRRGKAGTPIAVVTTMGVFSYPINLLPGPADAIYDLTLGRDWFNYCTNSVPDAQILLSRLDSSSSPFSAVHPHHTCEFLLL